MTLQIVEEPVNHGQQDAADILPEPVMKTAIITV